METTGLEGQTTMASASCEGLEHAGPGTGPVGPLEPHPGHGHVVAEADEVLLEADLGPVHQLSRVRSGSSVTGTTWTSTPHERASSRGDLAQGGAFGQALGAVAVGGQVLVAEVEPGDPTQTRRATP